MKKNGYTLVELLVVILLLGIATAIAVNKMSYAFDNNSEKLIKQENEYILAEAKIYGETIKDEIKNKTSLTIKINDLVEKNYLKADDKRGNFFSATDKSKVLNNKKIILQIDKNNNVIAKFEE